MRIRLAYGKTGLHIHLPDDWDVTVVEPAHVDGLPDPAQAARDALRAPFGAPPLAEMAGRLARAATARASPLRVGVIFSDLTRPTPNHILLPPILEELERAGVPRQAVTLFNALGTHRPNTGAELRGMLGDALVDGYRVVQNNAFDPSTQAQLGTSSRGHEVWLNRELVECDLKILTGFIEPHFFAGFSGGGKAVMPGMAGLKTVLGNHDAGMIGHPNATWGVTRGNPIWEEAREVALKATMSGFSEKSDVFLVNVALNRHKEITAVFAGGLDEAHRIGCDYVRRTAMVPVPRLFDIVVTTNSGYPLDLNLYQAVKGMSAAAQVVKPGGAIVAAAECWDGIPEHGLYAQLLREAGSPQELLDRICAPGFLAQDQWEAQVQAQVQLKADVYLHAGGLTDQQVVDCLLKPCHRIEDTLSMLRARCGHPASVCVLPEGPQTVAYLRQT